MRRALLYVAGAAVAAVAGGLAVVTYDEWPNRAADPNGVAVVCDDVAQKCWQRGRRVRRPGVNAFCVVRRQRTVWSQNGAGPTADYGSYYVCAGPD